MSDRPKPKRGAYAVLAFPLLMLLIFFVAPFGIMIAYSFYRRISGGFYDPAFDLGSWKRLFETRVPDRAVFSIGIRCWPGGVHRGVPFTFFLTRMRRRPHVALLILVLSALSLGGHVGFAWRSCWAGPRASRTSSSGWGDGRAPRVSTRLPGRAPRPQLHRVPLLRTDALSPARALTVR